jgi:hypothetical protein
MRVPLLSNVQHLLSYTATAVVLVDINVHCAVENAFSILCVKGHDPQSAYVFVLVIKSVNVVTLVNWR